MLIEAVGRPIRYRWPGGEVRLQPGRPVTLDDERAKKILLKCGPKVRKVEPDWEERWREIAQLTFGFEESDPHTPQVKRLVILLDQAFFGDDLGQFENYVAELKTIVGRD